MKRTRYIALAVSLFAVVLFQHISCLGSFYTQNIYPVIGSILCSISSLLPFAIGDLFIAASIAWVLAYPVYAIAYKKEKKGKVFGCVAEYLAWVYVWFYAAWGINYSQPSIYQRIGMKPAEVSKQAFRNFAYRYADSLNTAYDAAYSNKTKQENWRQTVVASVARGYENINKTTDMGINTPFCRSARAKTMVFSRLSSMVGVTGSMSPFFCEFTLNADIQPHEYAYIYAHEYAHLLGITNEGEANFYSYMVCTAPSADRFSRFSAYFQVHFIVLKYVRELLGDNEYKAYIKRLRPEIIRLGENDSRYWFALRSPLLDSTQNFVYNLYLRSNKVEDGVKSYLGVLGMIMAWDAHQKSL